MSNLNDVWFLRDIQCQLFEVCSGLLDEEHSTKEEAAEKLVKVIQCIDENMPEIKTKEVK